MEKWVRAQYIEAFCDANGNIIATKINLDAFRDALKAQRPDSAKDITSVVKRLDRETCSRICADATKDEAGRFRYPQAVRDLLQEARPDLTDPNRRKMIVKQLEAENMAAIQRASISGNSSSHSNVATAALPKPSKTTDPAVELYKWIQTRYRESAFTKVGFIGWSKFQKMLQQERPQQSSKIGPAINILRKPDHEYSLKDPQKVEQEKSHVRQQQHQAPSISTNASVAASVDQALPRSPVQFNFGSVLGQSPAFNFTASKSKNPSSPSPPPVRQIPGHNRPVAPAKATVDQVAKGMGKIKLQSQIIAPAPVASTSSDSESVECEAVNTPRTSTPDFTLYGQLLAGRNKRSKGGVQNRGSQRDLEQAPLFSGGIVQQHSQDLTPQYGLLGCLDGEDASLPASQVFMNTNAPLSTFICGVQGSGKSHTTSCILENAIIPSAHLGQLESPVSTLVFNYGEWSSGGAGFNISEATFLSKANARFPGHQAKRITVLVSPSNQAIKRLYAFKNVRIIPFRLSAKTLDIGALRTLMAIDDKAAMPLYMAKVESILRAIAAKSADGSLNYAEFKKQLDLESFDATQTNMLDMRLNLLESFLDMTGIAPQPDFLPGEITIMDLSDAFISPNTACILFKLGLERFLQCKAPGKLVVLDEAHKYMLNTPGSKILTDYLTKVIRLQRHLGARMVIATQEPTVSTDLIALCSVTVIHRFTSPAWYAALKKHIKAMDDDDKIMHAIEGLETGEAFVYAPNAVLGKNDDGTLIKATGRLLKLNIRDRVTRDGGESIMAV